MLKIQRATDKDAKVTVDLIKALLDELNGSPIEWDVAKAYDLCKAMIASEDYVVFHLANGDGQAVGVITISETESLYAGGKIGLIQELYVAPLMRLQSWGKALIEKAIEYAQERKWTRLEVGAPDYPRWARTRAFYLREGFKEIGPRLKYVL